MKLVMALSLLAGCFLPVATGAPEPATTVGHGKLGVMLSGEAPTLDLIANDKTGSNTYTDTYATAPAAAMRFTLSYGLTDDTDLEVAAEGELWAFVLPLPTGASIGLRQHIPLSETFDLAIAGRIGGVTSGTTSVDGSTSTSDSASAEYAAVQGVIQLRQGIVRPLASVNLMPFNIKRSPDGDPIQRFKGLASSATFGVMFVGKQVQVGPYVTITNFESTNFAGGWFPSGGLMIAVRPDRNRPPPPPQGPDPFAPYYRAPAPYAPPPGPYAPAPPGP